MAYLTPDLVQKGLSIASSFANGGMVAKFREGGDVDDDYGTFGEEELSASDPMGMEAAVAEAVAAGNTGTTAAEVSAALDAISDLDKSEGGGSLEERDAAIQALLDEAVTDTGVGEETGRFGGPKPSVDNLPGAIAEAYEQGRFNVAKMLEGKLAELTAAQAPAEKQVSVTEAAVQSAEPIDFLASGAGDPSRDFDRTTGPAAAPQVDADDMAGIGAVAPRTAVQGPPAGGIADIEPEFQQAYSPTELDEIQDFEDMAAAEQAATVGLQDKKAGLAALGTFAGGPLGAVAPFARDIFKTLAQPDVKAGELLAGKGLGRNQFAEEVLNEKGQRIGTVVKDPTGIVSVQPVSFKAAFDPALRDAYAELNTRQQEEREARDQGGDEPILPEDVAVEEEVDEAGKLPPTIDIIPFNAEDFYYFNPQSRYPYGLTSLMNMRTS